MTVTTVRPNSTDRNAGFSTSGAVAAHTVLSDTSNATIAQGNVHRGVLWLGLPSVTVDADTRLLRARIGLVYAHDGIDVGHVEAVNYRFRDPTLNVAGIDTQASTFSSTFPAATTPSYGPWNTTAPDGGAWTQAKIDRLQATLFALASANGSFLKVSELYVQYETNEQPVVSGVTVTGNTTTTRPSVTFTWSQAENNPQDRYQYNVFTQAQYSAAGFDPSTSQAAYSSGEIIGDATSFTIATDLLNTVTYKVYVRAAQAWAGPEGATWYSNWAASAAFTITVSPPPAPVLTVDQQLGIPHYRNRILISLMGLNVLDAESAGFENTAGNWVADANMGTPVRSTVNPKSGLGDLLLTSTAAGDMVARSGSFATSKRVTPGRPIAGTGSFRALVSPRACSVGVRYFDVTGLQVGTDVYGADFTDGTGGYVTATFSAIVPANVWSAVLLARVKATGAGSEQHRIDEMGLNYGTVSTWSPGGYLNGTISLQSSQRISKTITRGPARNYVHPQQYSGGALTTTTDGFYVRQANDSVTFRYLDVAPPEAPTNTTQGMIEWAIRVGAFSYLDIGAPDGVATDGMHPYLFPAVPGVDYAASIWIKTNSSTHTARLAVIYVNEYNTQVGSTTLSATANVTTTFQRVDVTSTAPTGTVYARFAVEDTAGTAGFSFFVTQPRFRPSSQEDANWPGQTFAFTWDDVRNATAFPIPQDGTHVVSIYDHEAPPGRPILYAARVNSTTPTGEPISSVLSNFVHVYMTPPSTTVLKDTSQPENAFPVLYRARGEQVTVDVDETQIHAAGRDKDPIFGRDWLGGDSGTLTVNLVDELSVYRLAQVSPTDRTVVIQWHLGGQTFAHITGRTLTRMREETDGTGRTCNAGTVAQAVLTYTEQQRPPP